MKRLGSFLLLVQLLASSCQTLDIKPDSSLSNDSYWTTESNVISAVNGLYSRMRASFTVHNWAYWYECRSGHIAAGLQAGGIANWVNNTLTPTMNDVNWQPFYQIISQANAIIQYAGDVTFSNTTQRDQLIAQAYFVRAWCYYHLVRLWGEVPLVTEFIDSDNHPQLYLSRSAVEDVFQQIVSDITQAELLYAINDASDRSRVSRAAILMLKSDLYLWLAKVRGGGQADLAVAESAIDEVLGYSAYRILDNYEDVFGMEENDEIIFAINYNLLEQTNQYGSLFAQSRSLVPAQYRDNPIPVGTNHVMQFSELFYERYRNRTAGDRRATVISDDLSINNTNFRFTNKFMGEMNGNARAFTTDTRIYRLAEAYLFKAEILAEKGEISEAVDWINKVVERAYGTPAFYDGGLSVDELKEVILDERCIELALECKSWFDLIRFGEAFTRVPSLVGRESDKQGNVLYLPVHLNSMAVNPNIEQTPGFE